VAYSFLARAAAIDTDPLQVKLVATTIALDDWFRDQPVRCAAPKS